ncbi:MAG TPA: DUF1549 and DUF1553 domain-containing protein [Verrucomicrobiales bacterium]|nr:DUF1549 and DUF1553 domain-containing protein [Verrucomicrobiales bacterium]
MTSIPFRAQQGAAQGLRGLGAAVAAAAWWAGLSLPQSAPGAPVKPEDHWAFQAPLRPSLPAVQNADWVRTPVDGFAMARLEDEGLMPAPEADRVTLLRRWSLTLTGLPPAVEEVDRFVADKAPEAERRALDRLLASPHYGERWGRHWLDAARYADSDGFEKDKTREVWFYRDWVVKAINDDLPYDEFIIEQLAGDLLPDATQDQVVATGFLRNSMVNEEGGIDPEQFRMEAMFDRMDAVGKSILGLTIQCAQCHDHKFDPIKQTDYYRMFAFLNNDHEANVAVYTPDEQMRAAEARRAVAEAEAELQHRHPDWKERMAEWEETVRRESAGWEVAQPEVEEISTGGQKYLPREDGSFLAQGYAPTKHTVTMTATTPHERITGFRLELLSDPDLPRGGPGRSIKGTAALTEFRVSAAPAAGGEAIEVVWGEAAADVNPAPAPLDKIFDDRSKVERLTGPVSFAVDGKGETAWGTDTGPGRRNQPATAVFWAKEPVGFPGGTMLTFSLQQNHGGWNSDDNQNHNLGRFRLAVTAVERESETPPVSERTLGWLAVPPAERSEAQWLGLFRAWYRAIPDLREEATAIGALLDDYPEGATQLVLQEREQGRVTQVLKRGDFLKPSERVDAAVPAFMHPIPGENDGSRLAFAHWLVDRESATTARALVNRVWQNHFGAGLVSSSEDLGSQAEAPSHPELLDWLAVEFMESGWSLKGLHRLILMSAAYRQSAAAAQDMLARDPYNRLLARGPRFRVEGEIVRDVALAASGLLDRRVGGPSVFPPAPDFLFQPPVSYGPKVWPVSTGGDRYRRGLYTFRYRSVPYPVFQIFDVPNGDFSCVRRVRSNTPLQALVTMNEPLFLDCARELARKALDCGGDDDRERITAAFRACAGRFPGEQEMAELEGLLQRQRERFREEPDQAAELAGTSILPGCDPGEQGSWVVLARVLLNLDETITLP